MGRGLWFISWVVLIVPGLLMAGDPARDFDPETLIEEPFEPLVDVPVIAARKVEDEVNDDELVLGVVIGGQARAYPLNMLTRPTREIINDELGGRAIAATW